MEWCNQVAVVTGGARGIGRATARLLAQRGAAVCVNHAVHADAAEALVAEIATSGRRAIAVAQTSPTQPRSRRWSLAPKQSWVR
jgi:NAD(P)-dependent dehydrogenase (short-subunit alcohol dehydrogenase family)